MDFFLEDTSITKKHTKTGIYINKCMNVTVFNFVLLNFHSDSLILKVRSPTP